MEMNDLTERIIEGSERISEIMIFTRRQLRVVQRKMPRREQSYPLIMAESICVERVCALTENAEIVA